MSNIETIKKVVFSSNCIISCFNHSLTLNLKRINSVEPPLSPDRDNATTLSSATYHTAPNSCGTPTLAPPTIDHLMSDSGVELRPPSARNHQDEMSCDDLSSNEGIISDSQSTSSIENHSPVARKCRRRDVEALRRLSYKITQHTLAIKRNLDGNIPKNHLDNQIAVSILCFYTDTG